VLQCVAVCCSVLQCVAVLFEANATHRNSMVQRVAVCYSVLQCVAVCFSVFQCVAPCLRLECVGVCWSVLQCFTVCCSVLQFVRRHMCQILFLICCNKYVTVLQCVAARGSVSQ